MPKIILHDTRLIGRVPPGSGTVITVDGTTPIADAFRRVAAAVNSSPAEFVIACHGYMGHEYGGQSHAALGGGSGLQLCREGLVIGNVSVASSLAGIFQRTWLMACGPAGTAVHDTRPFCRELASYLNCPVIASEREQTYHPGEYDNARGESRPTLRFGAWEGRVFTFNPDGTVSDFNQSETPLP
jgi:hypothetical protein